MTAAAAEKLNAYPAPLRDRLAALRLLIFRTAEQTSGVGPLEETLKWGQLSYLTTKSGSGTTVRIDQDKATGQPALYVNCNTNLLDRYRTLYPDSFDYEGNRGVIIGEAPDETALQHIIALALTYHSSKKPAR